MGFIHPSNFLHSVLVLTPAPRRTTTAHTQSESVGTVGALWLMQPSGHKPSNWNITAGPITGPTTGGSFLGRKGLALSQGAKVMAANSLNPKSAWV